MGINDLLTYVSRTVLTVLFLIIALLMILFNSPNLLLRYWGQVFLEAFGMIRELWDDANRSGK